MSRVSYWWTVGSGRGSPGNYHDLRRLVVTQAAAALSATTAPGRRRGRPCGPRPRPHRRRLTPPQGRAHPGQHVGAAGSCRCSSNTSISARVPAASPCRARAAAQNASWVGGERSGGAGLGQRGRAGQRARLAQQHLQVVVQDQATGCRGRSAARGQRPDVGRRRCDRSEARSDDPHPVRRSAGPAPSSDTAGP